MSNKQIFFDESGKRRKFVNTSLVMLLITLVTLTVFIAIYSYQLNKINNIANNTNLKEKTNDTGTSILYTSANNKAYPVISNQIEKLDTIILPKYLVDQKQISTPGEYNEQIYDIRFISNNKPVHYNEFYLLSSTNYALPPTERNNDLQDRSKINFPKLITEKETLAILNDLSLSEVKGLYVELDLLNLKDRDSTQELKKWLENTKKLVVSKDMEFGAMINAKEVNATNQEIFENIDKLYIKFTENKDRMSSIEQLASLNLTQNRQIIYEVPSISTEIDAKNESDYLKSMSYVDIESKLLNKTLTERTADGTNFTDGNSIFVINDAITANNFIQKLGSSGLSNDQAQFSISDPGFEEFTIWKLINDPYEDIRNFYLLREGSEASLNIKKVGEGEVISLEKEGGPAIRKLDQNQEFIASSTLTTRQSPTIVKKTGEKPKKIALTFDDGPHPEYTKKVLDILDDYSVKGTFFLIGTNVIANPEIAKEIIDRGHEVENHTYDHPIFSKLSEESRVNQIKANSDLIKAVTGEDVHFFRKPFSDDSEINTQQDIEYLESLEKLGLRASEYDIDSKDWLLDTPEEVTERVIGELKNSNEKYSQILLHDTHQNIRTTLESLPKIIEYLQKNNIEIVRVDELVSSQTGQMTTTTREYLAINLKNKFLAGFVWINVVMVFISLIKYLWIIVGALAYHLKHKLRLIFFARINQKMRNLPKLVIIISCYNEELVIGKTLQAFIDSTYPNFKVIAVNDGSKDKTAKVIKSYCEKDDRIKLIDLPNGGKAKALEKAIAMTKNEWLVFCDADTIFDKDALFGFADSVFTNKSVGAVAGRIYVGNRTNALTLSQAIEYGIAHIFVKSAQDIINSITVVPGALGLWNRKSLVNNGGFTSDTLAEDADATMKMISSGKIVKYFSSVTARTEAPENMKSLYKQRTRWQLGNMQATIKHSRGILRRQYAGLGFFGLPMMLQELIATIMFPFLLIFGIFVLVGRFYEWDFIIPGNLIFITTDWFLVFSLSLIVVEVVLAYFVIMNEKTNLRTKVAMIATIPYYITVYKTFLSYSTLVALMRAARGTLQGWGHLKRTAKVT